MTVSKSTFKTLSPTLRFAIALLKAVGIMLGMPLFMLFTLWVPTMAGDDESGEMMMLLFLAILR